MVYFFFFGGGCDYIVEVVDTSRINLNIHE